MVGSHVLEAQIVTLPYAKEYPLTLKMRKSEKVEKKKELD